MKVALVGYGGSCLDGLAEALDRPARACPTAEELMEAFAALEEELAETSPRSSISRPRFQEYKHQGHLGKTRYGRPWSSWGVSGSIFLASQARGPPRSEAAARIKGRIACNTPAPTPAMRPPAFSVEGVKISLIAKPPFCNGLGRWCIPAGPIVDEGQGICGAPALQEQFIPQRLSSR